MSDGLRVLVFLALSFVFRAGPSYASDSLVSKLMGRTATGTGVFWTPRPGEFGTGKPVELRTALTPNADGSINIRFITIQMLAPIGQSTEWIADAFDTDSLPLTIVGQSILQRCWKDTGDPYLSGYIEKAIGSVAEDEIKLHLIRGGLCTGEGPELIITKVSEQKLAFSITHAFITGAFGMDDSTASGTINIDPDRVIPWVDLNVSGGSNFYEGPADDDCRRNQLTWVDNMRRACQGSGGVLSPQVGNCSCYFHNNYYVCESRRDAARCNPH